MRKAALILGCVILAAACPPARAEEAVRPGDWPQWRGADRDGISREQGWTTRWPPGGPKVLWKAAVGKGFAAVSTRGNRAYTLGNLADHDDVVWCLDADTGAVVWKRAYPCPGSGGGYPGPAAAPAIDGNRVYTFSRVGHIACLDADTGRPVWFKKPEGRYKPSEKRHPSPMWHGASSNPLIVGDLLVLELYTDEGSVVAMNKMTGDIVWQAGDERMGYASPVAVTLAGRRTIVAFTGTGVLGIDAAGKPLWKYPWESKYQSSIITPIVSGDKVYVSSAQNVGATLLRIKDDRPEVVWQTKEMFNHYATPVLWKGFLYGLDGGQGCPREGPKTLLKCLDFQTGAVKWAQPGFGKGGLMLADGKLLVLGEEGRLAVVEASPDGYRELASAQVLSGPCWNMPVLSRGRIYCRSQAGDLVCLDVRPGGTQGPGR